MKKYGRKTRAISIILTATGIFFGIISFLLRNNAIFDGLISLSIIFIFSGMVIYFVIYRQFEKLEELAEDVEKGKI